MRLLLISNSGRPYLGHCRDEIAAFLGDIDRAAFVSAAAFMDGEKYLKIVQDALAPIELQLDHLDCHKDPLKTLEKAQAVLVGGGNTFKLLKSLREAHLLGPMREKVMAGMPYIGWSAGANVATPSVHTANDWNVVGLNRFDALNLVPFNVNPHYLETDPAMAPHSETRDMRIAEFHCVNNNTVLGIEEQTTVHVDGKTVEVLGQGRVRRFEWNREPVDFYEGDTIDIF